MEDWTAYEAKGRELVALLAQNHIEKWLHYGVNTFRWWLLVGLLMVPWLIWVKFADRRWLPESMLAGAMVIIITLLFDWTGYYLNFWDYPVELLPAVPGGLAFDLSVLPVPYMLMYLYLPSWRSYLLGLLFMTVVYAFIGEPLAIGLDLVSYIEWKNVYSVGYYVVTGVFTKAAVDTVMAFSRGTERGRPLRPQSGRGWAFRRSRSKV
ncbi:MULTISPECIES: CBO0543 family protein [Paenibacillus]|uniref:CBO0543 family protein n=1 Tax=Paenibacillus TaxID=44249 RepID=UPI0022B8B240|nr:CBO0543 family protein [Paenibacillus caseinilyticus]MCZ8522518.1 hypothetical protein [Paenibacillus caseinilyticus]